MGKFMKPEHEQWIRAHVPSDPNAVWNECQGWAKRMQQAFPDLVMVRGHVLISTGHERPHWWLLDGEQVVDPTAHQFRSDYYGGCATIVQYLPWDESQEEPTGRCPNCGGLCYHGESVCSDRCGDEYVAYLNDSIRRG